MTIHKLIADFSLPWYVFVGFGVFLTLLITSPKFRSESDALLAHMLGLKPKQDRARHTPRQTVDTDSNDNP